MPTATLHAVSPAADIWAELRRPLQLPAPTPGATCRVAKAHSPTAALGPVLGSGPTYPAGLGLAATLELNGAPAVAGYRYVKVLWVID